VRNLLIVAVIALGIWQIHEFRSGATPPWEEIGAAEFEQRVVRSPLPALVIFDTAPDCHGATPVFARLRSRWKDDLAILHIDVREDPAFAERHGVGREVTFALYENGREVRRTDAPALMRPLLGPGNTVESLEVFDDGYLAALESFAKLR
jgi:hypothetical protein